MKPVTIVLFLIAVSFTSLFPAEESQEVKPVKHRLELQYLLEYFSPKSFSSHPWKSLYVKYYGFPSTTFNYFVHAGTIFRDQKTDHILIFGTAHDWSDSFYTYTAIAAGTKADYLPEYRFDQDLNFKFGKLRNIVWTIGATYINYHIPANDLILSSGLMVYLPKLVIEYRLFRNRSNPGNVVSYTHLGSAGYGAEKKSWTYFTVSKGSQAYLATYITTPQEVRQKAMNLSLEHRRWITKNFGFAIDLDYVDLKQGYKKYGVFTSLFLEL